MKQKPEEIKLEAHVEAKKAEDFKEVTYKANASMSPDELIKKHTVEVLEEEDEVEQEED